MAKAKEEIKIRGIKLTSPTFESFTITLPIDNKLNLRKTFERIYSLKEAQYVDKMFEGFYKKLNSIAEEESRKVQKKFKQIYKNHLFGQILRELMPLTKITNEHPERLHGLIENAFHKLFFYADLVIITATNDYEGIIEIKQRKEEMDGNKTKVDNMKIYEQLFIENDNIIHKKGAGNWDQAVRNLAAKEKKKHVLDRVSEIDWNDKDY